MCGQADDSTQHDALTVREADAFRAYMIDLDAVSGAILADIPGDSPEYADYREGFGLGVEHKYENTSQVLPEYRSRSYYKGYEDGSAPDQPEWMRSCAACGSDHTWSGEKAEVINKQTGARALLHAECYLADRDCYSLA